MNDTRQITESDFALIRDRTLLKDHNYMEFYIGEFENSVEYWNDGAVFLDHNVYKILHPIFRQLRKDYDDYNVNRLTHTELKMLDDALSSFFSNFNAGALEKKLGLPKTTIVELTDNLRLDLSGLFRQGMSSSNTFWILGM